MPFEEINQIRRELWEGNRLGPRIGAVTGKILDGVETQMNLMVSTPEQARQVVRTYKQAGADFIKPYNQLSREVYLALVNEAREQNIPVEGHVQFSVTPQEVSDLGQRIIEHNFNVLVFCASNEIDLRKKTQAQPNLWGRIEAEAAANYDQQKADKLYARLVANGTWSCPTLVVYRNLRFTSDSILMQDSRIKYIPKPRQRWHQTYMQRIN
jgi:hypothetical protein